MTSSFPHLLHHFLEFNAETRPAKVAVVHNGRHTSYGEINERANVIAARLLENGVGAGHRVALFMENSVQYVVGYFGALKAGAAAVPLCSDLTAPGVDLLLRDLEPSALLTCGKQGQVLAKVGARLPLVIGEQNVRGGSGTFLPWAEVLSLPPEANPCLPLEEGALASIIYTSGSTGTPKGVMLSHRNIVANVRSIVEYLDLRESDVQMVVLPFYYVMGKSLLTTHFAVGGTVVLNNRFAFTGQLMEEMIAENVTGFSGVPSTYTYLLHRSPLAESRDRLHSLRYCTQAGGHLPRRTKEELLRVLPSHTRLYVMYGATEASARLAYVEPERLSEKLDSIGRPIPGVSLSVRNERGVELADGDTGEIVARGPNIMQGYWRDPAGTARVLDHLGYHTGDLGFRDRDGYFYVVGRKDSLLKIGGHRINPREVEEVLMGTELLVEVAVLGIDDTLQEPRLVAVAAPKHANCTDKEILRRCVQSLPRYKMPSVVTLVPALPKTPQGKVDNRRCRELAMGGLMQAAPR